MWWCMCVKHPACRLLATSPIEGMHGMLWWMGCGLICLSMQSVWQALASKDFEWSYRWPHGTDEFLLWHPWACLFWQPEGGLWVLWCCPFELCEWWCKSKPPIEKLNTFLGIGRELISFSISCAFWLPGLLWRWGNKCSYLFDESMMLIVGVFYLPGAVLQGFGGGAAPIPGIISVSAYASVVRLLW